MAGLSTLRVFVIIFVNDSNDSNHSSKFTVKKRRKTKQAKQIHNLLLNIVVFVCLSDLFCVILVNVDSWGVEINSIMRIVMYEYDEYFNL